MAQYYIGIDAGGTKTEAALCDRQGRILKQVRLSAGNPVDIGEEAFRSLMQTISEELSIGQSTLQAVFLGAAGASTKPIRTFCEEILKQAFPTAIQIGCQCDTENLHMGGLYGGDGCVVISGTGCNCVVYERGLVHCIGGWGHLLDMQGSGYDIGRDAVIAALRVLDGYGVPTVLYELLENRFQMPLGDAIPGLYEQSKEKFASLAPLVFEAAGRGDVVACGIIEKNMKALARWVQVASDYFEGEFPVVVAGGILTKGERAFESFERYLPPTAKATKMTTEPVFGAVMSAMLLDGVSVDAVRALTFVKEKK